MDEPHADHQTTRRRRPTDRTPDATKTGDTAAGGQPEEGERKPRRRRGDAARVTLADLRCHAGIQLHKDDWEHAINWLKAGNALEVAGCDDTHPLVEYLTGKTRSTRVCQTRQLSLDDVRAIVADKRGTVLIAGASGDEYDSARITLFARRNSISRSDAADWLSRLAGRRISIPALAVVGSTPIGSYGPPSYSMFTLRRANQIATTRD